MKEPNLISIALGLGAIGIFFGFVGGVDGDSMLIAGTILVASGVIAIAIVAAGTEQKN